MWWISYRGEGKTGVDNIGVFEDDGTPRAKHPLLLDPSPKAHALHIARGFALVGDDLYIANAWRRDSHVARYRRHGDNFHYAGIVVATNTLPRWSIRSTSSLATTAGFMSHVRTPTP